MCVVINFFINFHHGIIHSLSRILERNWENRLRFKIYPQSSSGNLSWARPGKIGQVTSLQMERNELQFRLLLFAFAFSWRPEDKGPLHSQEADGSWATLMPMKEKMCKIRKKWWASSGEATGGEADCANCRLTCPQRKERTVCPNNSRRAGATAYVQGPMKFHVRKSTHTVSPQNMMYKDNL